MRIRNVRFSNKDWMRLRMVGILAGLKISDIIRRGSLEYADAVAKRLKEAKEAEVAPKI